MSLIVLVLLLLPASQTPLTDPPDPPDSTEVPAATEASRSSPHAFGLWMGGSVASSQLIAKSSDASLQLIGLRYAYSLAERRSLALRYTADLIPAASLSYADLPVSPKTLYDPDVEFHRTDPPVLGVGITPVGIEMVFRPHARWQPFLSSSAGFMYFPQAVPDSRGKLFNFTADAGAGLRIVLSRHTALTVGYRFHHLSNGFRGRINPGFDTNIFYLGVSVSQ